MAGGSQVVWVTTLPVSPHAVVQEGAAPPRSGELYPPMDRQRPASRRVHHQLPFSERSSWFKSGGPRRPCAQ